MKTDMVPIVSKFDKSLQTEQVLEGDIFMPSPFSINRDFFGAMADRIVEEVLNQLIPFLLSKQTDDENLTIEEASEFLKKSKEQIYQWVNKTQHGLGDFPYFKAGRSLRFSKKALVEWMENNAKKR